jgi:hypothetical protein
MLTSEQIRSRAPIGATTYRLLAKLSDGSSRMFPADAAGFFRIGEAPANVPFGKYTVCYYDSANRLITYADDAIELSQALESPIGRAAATGQMPLSLHSATGGAASTQAVATPSKSARLSLPPASVVLPAASRLNGEGATVSESELELRRHMQAMDLEERQQEFLKTSTYVTELGEAFTLNRLMRRDMLEMHRIIVEHSQRAYQDIEQVKGTIHELLAMQKAVLAHAASALARPPPPPPDYVSLGHSALAVVKDVSAALITRQMGRELASRTRGEAQPGAAKAQLGDGSQAKEAEIDRASPSTEKSVAEGSGGAAAGDGARAATNSPRDVLGRLMQRLQSVSDAELVLAMSSVEGWKALLDSLSPADAAKDAAKDASAATSTETSAAAGTKEAARGA